MAEVRAEFERYEKALREHDVEQLNAFFLNSPDTVRYGIAQENYGFEAIASYRRTAVAVHPQRQLRHTVITGIGNDVACISTEFTDPVTVGLGRQTQTWVRTVTGWKIICAHVSASKAVR